MSEDKKVKLEIINPAGRQIIGIGGGAKGTVIEVFEELAKTLLADEPWSFKRYSPPPPPVVKAAPPVKPALPEKESENN